MMRFKRFDKAYQFGYLIYIPTYMINKPINPICIDIEYLFDTITEFYIALVSDKSIDRLPIT